MNKGLYLFILFFSFFNQVIKSQETRQPVFKLIVFEGSDWCPSCRRFEKKILSDTSFTGFLTKYNIGLKRVDFPQKKKQSEEELTANRLISESYSFAGLFPTVIISRTDTLYYKNIIYENQSVTEMEETVVQKMNQLK